MKHRRPRDRAGEAGAVRFVYGIGPVTELLRVRPEAVYEVALVDRSRTSAELDQLLALAESQGVSVRHARVEEVAETVRDANHQGVVAQARSYPYQTLEATLARAQAKSEAPLIVVLDSVTDPHNLGAVVRSAYLLGAHGVVVARDRSAQVTATVAKVSVGACEHLPIVQVTNLKRGLEELKAAGLWVAGASASPSARALWALDGCDPLAVVFGNEGRGLRAQTASTCDLHIKIPMPGAAAAAESAGSGIDSFNISVAAAIVLYEISRQRAANTTTAS